MPRKPSGPCLEPSCPEIATYRGRCADHARSNELLRGRRQQRGLGADHERLRRRVLKQEKTCWICGEGPRENDPLTADHIQPRIAGGQNVRENYRAAHLSCNSRRGAG